MKAVLYHEPGGPEVLKFEEVEDPVPGKGDVVVEVAATSLNRLDVLQRNGWFQMPGFVYPHISGMDIAGTVIEIGEDVSNVQLGDRVVVDPSLAGVSDASSLAGRGDLFGELGILGANADGGYAEKCLAPASHVYLIPDEISFEDAATFPTCYMTASHSLFKVGKLKKGETVIIHAAGSGVGVAAIQLAKNAGATVLATAGTDDKCERAMQLGASHVMNNREGDLAAWAREITQGEGVRMVMDCVGTALFGASLFAIGVKGRLVNCGNASGDEAVIPSLGYVFHSGISIHGSDPYEPEEFGPVWEEFCSGNYKTEIDSIYPLKDAGEAQEKMLSGAFFGKILLTP
ncbi:MAG: alcohol dehydrogenase [Actinobacteria bacterium]|nr:alcohol dehydrogenase [Actinomycetota bacterium]|tara:strand:+ start:8940 stop:9974 length:1035 start_codon:yes stop_codon:yes gene_type:complete